jgi:hypothetical protein
MCSASIPLEGQHFQFLCLKGLFFFLPSPTQLKQKKFYPIPSPPFNPPPPPQTWCILKCQCSIGRVLTIQAGRKITLYNLLQHVFRWWLYYHFIHTHKQNYLYDKTTIILNYAATHTDDFNTCTITKKKKKKVPLGNIYTET